jgi:2-oxo-3-hexenedioate decarboxylase
MADSLTLAREIADAYARRETIHPPSDRVEGFDLDQAYAIEAQLVQLRAAAGHRAVGRKVGFANKAMWRILQLETLVWAHMYDDSVRQAHGDSAELPIGRMFSPKIEPEIVFRLRAELEPGLTDAAAVLERVEWIALGVEIIDCVYPGWEFTPVDFVASFGLHAGLIVGTPLAVDASNIGALSEQLASFKVTLSKNGAAVAQGAGKNSLRNPALCLAELATAASRRGEPLAAGELISSGTLTEAQHIAAGETWFAEVSGMSLPGLTVRTI